MCLAKMIFNLIVNFPALYETLRFNMAFRIVKVSTALKVS